MVVTDYDLKKAKLQTSPSGGQSQTTCQTKRS